MTDDICRLVGRYRSRGVLVDTNILLLYFVGSFKRKMISRFKRTRQFVVQDYDLLVQFISCFDRMVTTPNILSEVNSLSSQIGEPARTKYFAEFARQIDILSEQYVPSTDVARLDSFPKFGLTDTGIMHIVKGNYLVLTDDHNLYQFLGSKGIDALNFTHLRAAGLLD